MRADVKAELQMLRELVWFAYASSEGWEGHGQPHDTYAEYRFFRSCCFCHLPLMLRDPQMSFGHRRHPKVDTEITIHHEDGNRENNAHWNLKPCHSSCHKSYHNQLRAATRKEIVNRVRAAAEREESNRQDAATFIAIR